MSELKIDPVTLTERNKIADRAGKLPAFACTARLLSPPTLATLRLPEAVVASDRWA